ncbi:outer membrane beta-barrel protein [Pontibacter sp. HSC-36F09]|uniref:outer membrane beta-barrel protein n=1 Tax=Pontibacter sp. HSC-36F09 TaxID=2910966 RepID=UPI00209D5EE7|nr:outer membrane beta-barrel protein [Pontibacter sp. HSC-36F09]MCP2042888.1 opacity protein-like surface antigen [Pontibacter sp. HSC-36F09]
MKKKLLISCFSMLVFISAQAQDSLQVKPQVSAPYKLAVGLRYSTGGPMGVDLGVSAKYFIGRESALEAHTALSPAARFHLTSLSYIWQPKLLTSERFRPYAGIGAGLLTVRDGFSNDDAKYTRAVAVATFGVEYKFKKVPIAISLDYRSTFIRFGPAVPAYYNLNNTSNIGLGVKYTFR